MRKDGLALPLALAAVLWTAGALGRSLWGDEFHTLQHVRADTFAGFLEVLRSDNHPPLSFALVRVSRALFGESELALRLPSLAVGLAFVFLTWRAARRLPEGSARTLAPIVVALSSFAFTVFSEARMYGLLALAVLGLVLALADALERTPGGARRTALWVAVGLHAHYYFVHYAVVLALAVLFHVWRRKEARRDGFRLAGAALTGTLAFVPWALFGLTAQLEHGLPSGASSGTYLTLAGLAQGYAHLFFLNASLGGSWVSLGVALPGTLAAAVLGLRGLGRLVGRARRGEGAPLALLLVAGGVVVPLWAFGAAHLFERASFNWRYLAGSLGPLSLVLALGAGDVRRFSRGVLAAAFVTALAFVTLVNALSPGQEDYRGAVRHVLARAQRGDAIVTKPIWDADPAGSPTGWTYYRDRIGPRDENEPVEFRVDAWRDALEHERVWLFVRSRFPSWVLEGLEARYGPPQITPIGNVMTVHLYAR